MNKLTFVLLTLFAGAAGAQQYPSPAGAPAYPQPGYQAPPPPPPAAPVVYGNSVPKFTVPVVSATPAYQMQTRERKVCDHSAQQGGGTSVAGTLLGGVAGGILGNQIGRGKGRTVATAAGAVGGALAGNAIANNMQDKPACQMVAEQVQVPVGYDVTYEFGGQRGQVRMPQQPGSTIVVEVRPAGY